MDDNASINTDRILFTESNKDWKDEGYMPRIFVTQNEAIGISVGGMVYVMTLKEWHKLAEQHYKFKDIG